MTRNGLVWLVGRSIWTLSLVPLIGFPIQTSRQTSLTVAGQTAVTYTYYCFIMYGIAVHVMRLFVQ